jgi:hypothetical protein
LNFEAQVGRELRPIQFAIHKEKEMADLRRWITALAILALFTGLASAQVGGGGGTQLNCSVNTAATPTLRAEGITEQIGDIVITCTGGTVLATGTPVPQVNITVSLASQVTSRLLGNVSGLNASEALLMLDEPNSGLPPVIAGFGPAEPFTVCNTPNTGCPAWADVQFAGGNPIETAVSTQGGTTPAPNVYQGVVSGNQVTFFGVPILAPGTTDARVIRITNVRTNANGIGGGSASGSIPVQASLLTSNFAALPISNAQPIVGFVQLGLTASVGPATPFGQCVSQSSVSVPTATVLTFGENFGTAFKTRIDPRNPTLPSGTSAQSGLQYQTVPGVVYNSESGFTMSTTSVPPAAGAFGGATAGLADFGTRLKATFNNIPTGARLWVSLYNVTTSKGAITGQQAPPATPTSTTSFAQLVTSETVSDGSSFPGQTAATGVSSFSGGVSVVEITPTSGNSAAAVWEVVNTNPNANETLQFGVFVSYVASPGTNSPAAGTGTVNLSFAPTSTVTTASSSGTIPRFIDTSTAKTAISIAICRTILLYPFVTNQVGFDTGLAISNTSTDPFGTTPQAGTCTLNWYGANSVPVITTPVVATATTYTTLTSVVAPNFQGYMIAVCGFQYAHGFAFVSDIGARNLAMGYLPLIVPDPSLIVGGRLANPVSVAPTSTGESLAP